GLANPRTRTTMRPPRKVTKPRASLPGRASSGERRSGPPRSRRDDLRDRGERDLFGRLRSEIETDRRVHAREGAIGNPGRAQLVQQITGVTTASHHPEIRRLRQEEHAQRLLRELTIVTSDHDVAFRSDA